MRRKLKTLGKRVVVLMMCLAMLSVDTGGMQVYAGEGAPGNREETTADTGSDLTGSADETNKDAAGEDDNTWGAADGVNKPASGENGDTSGATDGTNGSAAGEDDNGQDITDGTDQPASGENSNASGATDDTDQSATGDNSTRPGTAGGTDQSASGEDHNTPDTGDGENGSAADEDGSKPGTSDGTEKPAAGEGTDQPVIGEEAGQPDGSDEKEDLITGEEEVEELEIWEEIPEESFGNAEIFGKFQSGSLSDLMDVDEDSVTAAMTFTGAAPSKVRRRKVRVASRSVSGNDGAEIIEEDPVEPEDTGSWSAAAYYVGKADPYDTTETDNFSVKYQIEFHADTEIPEYGVKFRVPGYLLTERDGKKHYADDIAVPKAEVIKDGDGNVTYKPVKAKTISFNYYEEDGNYVFFNYESLPRGTNAAFQVLYKKMDVMYLVDGTEWELPVTAEVKTSGSAAPETRELAVLRGRLDTKVEMTGATKAAYYSPGTINYTPGLYTRRQVDEYASAFKTSAYEEIVEENFDDYFYAVWAVALSAKGNQGFFLDIKENLPEGAKIVGVSAENQPGIALRFQKSPKGNPDDPDDPNQFRVYADGIGYEQGTKDGSVYQMVRSADYRTIRIVTAYPRERLEDGTFPQVEAGAGYSGYNVTNSITASATGVDGKDAPFELTSGEGSFTYREYKWTPSTPSYSSSKSNAEGGVYSTFNGWNNVYLQSKKAGKDRGDFTFNTSVSMQDYQYTHDTDAKGVPAKPGCYSRLTVADDLMYLSRKEGGMDYTDGGINGNNYLLTEDDYYFSSVKVNLKDYGFDTTEDVKVSTDQDETYEWRSTKVYAMFAKPGAGDTADAQGWYLVYGQDAADGGKPFSEYNFSEADLMKEPYRVKVVQESNAHTLSAVLKVTVRFRKDSPVLNDADKLGEYIAKLEDGVTLENNVGFIREQVKVDENGNVVCTVPSYVGNSDIHDLARVRQDEEDLNLYDNVKPERYRNWQQGDPYVRSNTQGFAYLNPAKPRSKTFKYGTISNDPVNERVNQRYNLVVYNGYSIYDGTIVNYMKEAAAELGSEYTVSPGHKDVVFYDLLPLGVKFDPSQKIVAGRITSLDEDIIKKYPASWEQDDVTVTVDPKTDLINDYNGTGRTLVRFHLSYANDDPSCYVTYKDNRMWMEGFGVSFGSYYAWKDEKIAKDAENIFAFSTAAGDDRDLVGSKAGAYKVCTDSGELPWISDSNSASDNAYRLLVADENGDLTGGIRGGNTETKSILFGKGRTEDEFARSSEAKVIKRVRADDDLYGEYSDEAEVCLGQDYTYEVTVSVTQGEVENLVVSDNLEKAATNLSATDLVKVDKGELSFDENWWYGTFQGVSTAELEDIGVAPVVYYNADRNAEKLSAGDISKGEMHGWVKASEWITDERSLADVKAVAIDMSKKKDGKPFVLSNMDAVSFRIRMQAPQAYQEKTDLTEDEIAREDPEEPATWAYNNSSYSASNVEVTNLPLNTSDAVRVRLRDSRKLAVEKEFKDRNNVPESYQDASFTMKIEQTLEKKEADGEDISNYTNYASKSYILYERDETGAWKQVDSVIRATDADGCLTLKAGQRAELNISDRASYRVTEVESPFWKQECEMEETAEETKDDGSVSPGKVEYRFINEYRPVLYVQKSVIGYPTTAETKKEDLEFKFQLFTLDDNGEEVAAAAQEYWVVDSAYGDMPTRLETRKTGATGNFTVKPGEILAMFPGDLGTKYVVRETLPEGGDWIAYNGKDSAQGTLGLTVSRATISNLYRWRELAIAKKLTNQDAEECTQAFTFRVEKMTEDAEGNITTAPISGNEWVLCNADGTACEAADGLTVSGTLDENGRFSAACAGKIVKIRNLEAGVRYLVSEEVYEDGTSAAKMEDGRAVEGSDYRPLVSQMIADMPVYSAKRDITFTNDYLLRPIMITKTVAYNAAEMSAEDLAELKDKTFTMTIFVENEKGELKPYKNKEFTRNGAAGNSALKTVTDRNGEFEIRDGETVTFKAVGREGLKYRIVETQDAAYGQIYPAAGSDDVIPPVEDAIRSDGGRAVFINGTPGLLMLGKEYTAGTDDGAAGAYLTKIKDNPVTREKEAVTMTLEIKGADGKWTPFQPSDAIKEQPVTIIDTLGAADPAGAAEGENTPDTEDTAEDESVPETGETPETMLWKDFIDENGTFRIEPWKRVVIPMDGTTVYRVSESEEDRSKLYRTQDCGLEEYGGYLAVEAQKETAEGTVEKQPVVTLINNIRGILPASGIGKAMRGGSNPVPQGAKLVFQVQKYTGAGWEPAKDVEYIVTDYDPTVAADRQQEILVSSGVEKTGGDGKITVSKSDDSDYTAQERNTQRFPRISFVGSLVQPEAVDANWKAGDYRLVELLAESSENWGNWYQSTWDENQKTGTIWNSNKSYKVRIEKQLEEEVVDDGTEFTFTLKQVTKLKDNTTGSITADDILADKAAGGMQYYIYDADGNYVGLSTTNAAGEIRLKAGQYAELKVSDATKWTVSEKQDTEMKLTNLTAMGSAQMSAGKLAANLAVINANAGRVPAYIKAESDSDYVLYDAKGNIRNKFTVTLYWSDDSEPVTLTLKGSEDGENDGKYTMTTEEQEDGSVKCRFESAEYEALFDTLVLKKQADGESVEFDFTGEVQTYTVPADGIYEIELWGASGGGDQNQNRGSRAGLGGYVTGWVTLKKDTVLYIYVGGQGKVCSNTGRPTGGGWNGGGGSKSASGCGGGGATDIRIISCEISELTGEPLSDPRIMVAGAGGGADNITGELKGGGDDGSGGYGGGWTGGNGYTSGRISTSVPAGGSHKTNGTIAGRGEDGRAGADPGGGGGGWFGGRGSDNNNGGGAGGSSYISGITPDLDSTPGYQFISGSTIAGNGVMPTPNGETETGHWGNGYARIQRVG